MTIRWFLKSRHGLSTHTNYHNCDIKRTVFTLSYMSVINCRTDGQTNERPKLLVEKLVRDLKLSNRRNNRQEHEFAVKMHINDITMPCDDIERRVGLPGAEKRILILGYDLEFAVAILEPGARSAEVSVKLSTMMNLTVRHGTNKMPYNGTSCLFMPYTHIH